MQGRAHHRRYDRGELDLLAQLESRYHAELAQALAHLSLLRLVSGTRWRPD